MSFFNSENWLWQGFGRLADYFIISVMWLICCIPLVTIGPSSIAMYDTIAHCVRGGEKDMLKRFFRTFKQELGRGIAMTVLWAVLCFLLNMGYQIVCQMTEGSGVWSVFSMVYFVSLLIPLGILCWAVTIESRFAYSFAQLHRTAFFFTFGHLPHTLAIALLLVLALNVLINFPFLVMFIPAVMAHLQSFFVERVFAKHMPAEEPEEIEE